MVTTHAEPLTIRDLDDRLRTRLRVRADRNGRSIEAEAQSILTAALASETAEAVNFVDAIRRHVDPLGGIELPEHPSVAIGDPFRLER